VFAEELPTEEMIVPIPSADAAPVDAPPDAAVGALPDVPNAVNSSSALPRSFLPILMRPGSTVTPIPQDRNDTLAYVNYFRAVTKVPLVRFDAGLNNNCWLHARYMAEENHLTHSEHPGSPWYSGEGQLCGQQGNAWLGSEYSRPYWQTHHSIDGWISSVGHRLWLLYPTTSVFGYGFYTAANNRAGAALDVLSYFNSNADQSYAGWPVRFPGPGQVDVPAQAVALTLNWRYHGPVPTVGGVTLVTASGQPIAHTVSTDLPVGHKGIAIRPTENLPPNTTINVTVSGTYDGEPFSYSWSFKTGN
jgi:uncharacterized protein YkwD